MALTHALLLSAGLGTRLRPLTLVRAKAAMPVAGVPIVRRIIQWLTQWDVEDVVINLHHLPETIASVVGDGRDLGVRARYSWEQPDVLGSAGGPRQARDIIGADTFLIVNGDTLTDAALPGLIAAHGSTGALVTMAVIANSQPHRYSGLRLADDGAVLGVEPRGSSRRSFHFIGVQLADSRAFDGAPAGRPSSSIGEVYDSMIAASPGSIRAHVCDARFWDIGTVADYWTTARAFDEDATLTRNPTLAPHVTGRSQLVDTIVWDDVVIGDGCNVCRCIVTDGVHLQAGSNFSDAILLRGADGETVAVPFAAESR
jgi:mannose-1-phosphate guanylyltransferase